MYCIAVAVVAIVKNVGMSFGMQREGYCICNIYTFNCADEIKH